MAAGSSQADAVSDLLLARQTDYARQADLAASETFEGTTGRVDRDPADAPAARSVIGILTDGLYDPFLKLTGGAVCRKRAVAASLNQRRFRSRLYWRLFSIAAALESSRTLSPAPADQIPSSLRTDYGRAKLEQSADERAIEECARLEH